MARAIRGSGVKAVKEVALSRWFDYRLQNDPLFQRRIEQARSSLLAGHGLKLEDIGEE
jgi:hypothetical protein